jgi:hypothetical protein
MNSSHERSLKKNSIQDEVNETQETVVHVVPSGAGGKQIRSPFLMLRRITLNPHWSS